MSTKVPGRRASLGALVVCVLHGAVGAGCAGAPSGAATHVTTPTASTVEPRGPTGQQLEDLFFAHVAGTSRFDLDAALDEGGAVETNYYDDMAAGEYYDETAAGVTGEVSAAREVAFIELREVDQQLAQLEQGLRAESHPLEADISEIRFQVAAILEHPDDYAEGEDVVFLQASALSTLLSAAEAHVASSAARPSDPTDCSVATLVLYAMVYDTLVEVSADAHVTLSGYVAEQDEWLEDQRRHMSAATSIVEWLDAHPAVGVDDDFDEFFAYLDALEDVEEYLTSGSEAGVDAVLDGIFDIETDAALQAELSALRSAVLATLANVPQPPYVAEIQAYEGVEQGLREAREKLPEPGPRAALRALRHRRVPELLVTLDWPAESLSAVVSWTRSACEGSASAP